MPSLKEQAIDLLQGLREMQGLDVQPKPIDLELRVALAGWLEWIEGMPS